MTIAQPANRQEDRAGNLTWVEVFAQLATILLCVLHGALIWKAIGGWEGMANDWPPLQDDHGMHYHHGLASRQFLRSTGMTAGYDPAFMSGYPMSVVTDPSSTLTYLIMMVSGDRPALGYKVQVFGSAELLPWLIALAAMAWRGRPVAVLIAAALFEVYFWSDAYAYAKLGMTNFLLSVPLGLLAVAGLSGYCERGGFGRWMLAWTLCSAVFLVHPTSPMVVGPAGLLAYLVASTRSRGEGRSFPASRHAGFWALLPAILAASAFWLVPGYLLASTIGESGFVFSHPEGVWRRLVAIAWSDKPVSVVLVGLAPLGLVTLARRRAVAAAGLAGFLAAGFGWGYLAGVFRELDAIQPGRQTCAFYSAACVAAGIGLAEVLARLRVTRSGRLDRWFALALLLLGVRFLGPLLDLSVRAQVFEDQFLSSRPVPRIARVVENVRKHLKPGERLLFEETGLALPGLGDPFQGRHCSPILPERTGVEVLGGPYLHCPVITNFTQFGENKLFGNDRWDRDFFVRYARLYRPAAICCWSPKARGFCLANPDLIRVVEDDGILLLGRVIGFEGAAIRGSARVEATSNRLVVRDAVAEPGGDGLVVLRYHFVPYLKADPPVAIEPVKLEDDPVPFIGLKPTKGPVAIEMVLPPRSWPSRSK